MEKVWSLCGGLYQYHTNWVTVLPTAWTQNWKRSMGTLEQLYQQQSTARKSYILKELQSAHKGINTINVYLHRIKSISDSLGAINERIKDIDLVHYTLNGLGPEYGPFVTTIEHRSPSITFSELRSSLLTHEQRLAHGLAINNLPLWIPAPTQHFMPPINTIFCPVLNFDKDFSSKLKFV